MPINQVDRSRWAKSGGGGDRQAFTLKLVQKARCMLYSGRTHCVLIDDSESFLRLLRTSWEAAGRVTI